MKNVKVLLSAALALVGVVAMAQDFSDDAKYGKYGATPEERKDNIYLLNFFNEAVGNQDYQLAGGYLQQLLQRCPKASENIYAKGSTVLKNKIVRAKNIQEKNVFVDSLMLLYDLRVEHFGDHATRGKAYILDRKARDFLTYRPTDHDGVLDAFRAALDEQLTADLALIYFKQLTDYYKEDGEGDPETIIAEYDRLTPAFAENADDKAKFDACFGLSGVANCENLEKMFKPQLEAPDCSDAVLARAVGLMTRANCQSDFYLAAAERLYKIQPSAETAMMLAQSFLNKSQFEKATEYLREALAVEQDPGEKEKLLVHVGLVEIAAKRYPEAMRAAREALEIDPEDGKAFFILGQCYGAQASGANFNTQTVYWVAYDQMQKAVELLPDGDTFKDTARQLAAAYRSGFPTQEECFFNEVQAGQRYVAAGVATTVRYR